jgi:hypothetical protein
LTDRDCLIFMLVRTAVSMKLDEAEDILETGYSIMLPEKHRATLLRFFALPIA